MGLQRDLGRADSGLYFRNLGKKLTAMGKYSQHKFYLGRDELKARAAASRLEMLWKQVCVRWEGDHHFEMAPTKEPVWDVTTLTIADAIRSGETIARVQHPSYLSAFVPECPFLAEWLDQIQKDITVIRVELVDEQAGKQADDVVQNETKRWAEMGMRLRRVRTRGDQVYGP